MKRPEHRGTVSEACRIIKVNHAGEFGAVNIYHAQILAARLTAPSLIPVLQDFLSHEQRHLETFRDFLASRHAPRCRSYLLCGIGGYALGFLTALLGKPGIMACTAAVETVVTRHLEDQMVYLRRIGEEEAAQAVASIVDDEVEHRQTGVAHGRASLLFRPVGAVVSVATSSVIWLGMHL